MKARETCKCGASIEVSGMPGNVGDHFANWRVFHQLVCYGVKKVRRSEDGRTLISRSEHDAPPDRALTRRQGPS